MKYQDLNLRKIREDNGLDFAHFTYLRGMCSCCFSPLELPARYWHKGIKPASMDNVQYLLFKNADNGSGWVKKTDEIKDYQCISWEFPETKLVQICKDLQEQLEDEYVVLVPESKDFCIVIIKASESDLLATELKRGHHHILEE